MRPQFSSICIVEGCGGAHGLRRGLCTKHYMRNRRNGHPEKTVGTLAGQPQEWFDQVLMNFESDECLAWPFAGKSTKDRPRMMVGEKLEQVARIACAEVNGPPPTPEHQAAHNCGKGWCINKRHVRWATRVENETDKIGHGTRLRGQRVTGCKLAEDDVLFIYSSDLTDRELARRFSVSTYAIWSIQHEFTWSWLTNPVAVASARTWVGAAIDRTASVLDRAAIAVVSKGDEALK